METETAQNIIDSVMINVIDGVMIRLAFAFTYNTIPINAYYLLLAYSELERGEFFQARQSLNDIYVRMRSAKARAKVYEAIAILDAHLNAGGEIVI